MAAQTTYSLILLSKLVTSFEVSNTDSLQTILQSPKNSNLVLKSHYRTRRRNDGWFEETGDDVLSRECHEERCDREELNEIFPDDEAKQEVEWKKLTKPCTYSDKGRCSSEGTQVCVASWNDFRCICKSGFEGDKCDDDVDECSLSEGVSKCTAANSVCVNKRGSYDCECENGYVADKNSEDLVCLEITTTTETAPTTTAPALAPALTEPDTTTELKPTTIKIETTTSIEELPVHAPTTEEPGSAEPTTTTTTTEEPTTTEVVTTTTTEEATTLEPTTTTTEATTTEEEEATTVKLAENCAEEFDPLEIEEQAPELFIETEAPPEIPAFAPIQEVNDEAENCEEAFTVAMNAPTTEEILVETEQVPELDDLSFNLGPVEEVDDSCEE